MLYPDLVQNVRMHTSQVMHTGCMNLSLHMSIDTKRVLRDISGLKHNVLEIISILIHL